MYCRTSCCYRIFSHLRAWSHGHPVVFSGTLSWQRKLRGKCAHRARKMALQKVARCTHHSCEKTSSTSSVPGYIKPWSIPRFGLTSKDHGRQALFALHYSLATEIVLTAPHIDDAAFSPSHRVGGLECARCANPSVPRHPSRRRINDVGPRGYQGLPHP